MTLTSRISPAFLASGLLHLAVLAALVLVRAPAGDPAGEGPPVAVSLVTSGDFAAAQADSVPAADAASAAPSTPVPAEPEPAPIPPSPAVPTPTPPKPPSVQKSPPTLAPRSAATPAAAPARPPAPAKRASGGLDLDALAGQVARLGGSRPGPAVSAGGATSGPSAAALAGLQDQLQRRWTPNCEVEGGRDVRVRVSFGLSPGGDLAGPVEAGGLERSDNAVVRAAAERAIRAVLQAAPFPALASPAGQRIAVNFNAREACS
ncbi:MAG: energy transducer TonB [Phenylobacterium sp.]|uniref:energy transducer TonB n=1 Tax=Phenylobacterium sp. TaxID=1871053 RepID=UPI0025EF4AFC|nr:energy transducer TonB [Phenylobacterium sp.]MCA3739063.1 energy transducer TonB [Phenylobacterium sp.]